MVLRRRLINEEIESARRDLGIELAEEEAAELVDLNNDLAPDEEKMFAMMPKKPTL